MDEAVLVWGTEPHPQNLMVESIEA
jgi:hypothetical protein